MCVRYLGFVLLIWFPGALHAQSAAQSCSAPRLGGGFFAPKQETYSDGTKLTYTCNEGRKPAVKGWWATSTCHNGKWSPEPQCIEEKACLPPDIPNAKYTEYQSGWYRDGQRVRITCDDGYEPKYRHVTAKCNGGTWTSVPLCEKSIHACGEPPKIPHAVIINQEYQEVFAVDSEVQYKCEDGYTVEGADTKKSIICMYGNWTDGPACRPSTPSGSPERNSKPQFTTVDHCGAYPNVPNGDVVEMDQTFLKYRCNAFYTQVGSGTVVCYSDGTWSQLPICKEAFCVLDPAEHDGAHFKLSGAEYLKEGEEKDIPCIQQDYSSRVQCTNGKINFTQCRETKPAAGQGGSATAGGHTTSAGSGTRPTGGGRETRPGTGQGGGTSGSGTRPAGGGRETKPAAGQGGSATAGGHTTSTSSGTRPTGGGRETRPGTGQGGGTSGSGTRPAGGGRETKPAAGQGGSATAGGNTTSTSSGTQPTGGGRETRPGTGQGGGTSGRGTRPAGGGSSTTSGSNDRESELTFRAVEDCGAQPNVPNGDVIQKDRMALKYECKDFHTLVGSDTVVCYSDGSWSPLPICKETYCLLDPAQNPLPDVELSRPEYLNEGEQKHFWCIWQDYSRLVRCSNRRITFTRCCRTYQHQRGQCT